MAKSRRSRRSRRSKTAEQPQVTSKKTDATVSESPQATEATSNGHSTTGSVTKEGINFSREYYYVFTEVRNILLIGAIMFVLLFGMANYI